MHGHSIPFHKYQALGNDFVLLDLRRVTIGDAAALSRTLCARHTGVGADGLILAGDDPECAARMVFLNPDGSRAGMCGNGIRCLARYLRDTGRAASDTFRIMCDGGPRRVRILGAHVEACLGPPTFEPDRIPVLATPDAVRRLRVDVPGFPALPPAVCLSVGNPHCVFLVDDLQGFAPRRIGPLVENHRLFPERINVVFAQVTTADRIACAVWERGAGETCACGSGASAALVAATVRGLATGRARVELPGGELDVTWDSDDGVTIAGAAQAVFLGEVLIDRRLAAPVPR